MMKKMLFVGITLMLVGCGRSSLYEEGMVDINVGVTPLTEAQVTQDQVNNMLDQFQFELVYLADKPVCDANKTCVWWAEGAVPRDSMDKLPGFFDKTLRVVSVQKVTGDDSVSPLPPR